MIEQLVQHILNAKRVYLCGNGGSAANAMHIANDLVSCGVRAHPLVADVATLTAIANDYGYHHVFSRQLNVFGEKGDLLIALSGSGESRNIINAIDEARHKGMTVAVLSRDGSTAHAMADFFMETPPDMQDAENAQIFYGHQAMKMLLKIKENQK